MEETRESSSPPVEISVKCEPPEFAEYDVDDQHPAIETGTAAPLMNGTTVNVQGAPAAKRPRVEMTQNRITEVTFAPGPFCSCNGGHGRGSAWAWRGLPTSYSSRDREGRGTQADSLCHPQQTILNSLTT
jgi:hypothetical protein